MQDYKYFFIKSKVHFDSPERNRLHTKLWNAWQKLRFFDTDKVIEFLLPFYSATGRAAKNQPQILWSFFLYPEGLVKPSFTLWVDRLNNNRVFATFMKMKKDYMENDQLLPAYNIQIGVEDEYIAVTKVKQHCTDMDCSVPLMEKFHEIYGFYPKYPVADAAYGSFNNYLFCQEHGMEKYMKFLIYKKETKDEKYRNDPFRAVNFKTNEKEQLLCPNGKSFHFSYRKPVNGNQYGRQEEYYTCADCIGCPYAERCKRQIRTEQSGSMRN